ncbi:hypothetical protein RYX36_007881 [Vicia faba]
MLDLDTGRPYGCEIIKAKRDEDEKFIWKGWTDFARRRQLKRGDVVHLSLVNPYDRLTVSVTNWCIDNSVVICRHRVLVAKPMEQEKVIYLVTSVKLYNIKSMHMLG